MKFYVAIIICVVLFTTSCKNQEPIKCNVKWNVEVVYINGDIDTLQCETKTDIKCFELCELFLDSKAACLRSDNGLLYLTTC